MVVPRQPLVPAKHVPEFLVGHAEVAHEHVAVRADKLKRVFDTEFGRIKDEKEGREKEDKEEDEKEGREGRTRRKDEKELRGSHILVHMVFSGSAAIIQIPNNARYTHGWVQLVVYWGFSSISSF